MKSFYSILILTVINAICSAAFQIHPISHTASASSISISLSPFPTSTTPSLPLLVRPQRCPTTTAVFAKNEEEEVRVGTNEYYAGFFNRDLQEAEERVTGDKILTPTLKFVGGFAVIIGALFIGFMASNGLI